MEPVSLGPYRITGQLGVGGMGVVFRAVDPGSGEEVALKTARANTETAASIRAEIRALGRVRHPRVVRVLGEGVDAGVPWYAMEIVAGKTWQAFNQELWRRAPPEDGSSETMDPSALDGRTGEAHPSGFAFSSGMVRPGPLAEQRAVAGAGRLGEILTLARRLCVPLSLLHGVGIVHRDVKPANVIIRPDGTPVLMDFGVVARNRGAVGREQIQAGGSVVGTLAYMSPEQAQGQQVDARADLYSLGCILYESVTGRLPITGENVANFLARVVSQAPLPPSTWVDGLPPALEELILALLAKSPRERIGHADDVAEILAGLGAVDDAEPTPAPAYLYRPTMAGREETLRTFEDALDRARRGKGAVGMVGGESGSGKTLLANEIARLATSRRIPVIVGECLPVLVSDGTHIDPSGAPLHPFRPLFQAVLDACRRGGAGTTAVLLGPHAATLAPYEPGFEHLPSAGAHGPAVGGELGRRRVIEAVVAVVAAFCERSGSLLLVLDDLQWADELTLDVLRAFTPAWVAARPLMLVATYRSDEADEALRALLRPGVVEVQLARLDEASVSAVVSDMLAVVEPPPAFVHFIATQTEGNPFFVAEYLRLAVAEGLLVRRDGRWRLQQEDGPGAFAHLPQPRSVRELVERRLSAVPAAARALLDAAAVLGRELPRLLLLAVEGTDAETASQPLRELVERNVLELTDGDRLRFTHDKIREAVYASLDPARARTLHRLVAQAVESAHVADGDALPYAVLAQHWRGAEEWAHAVDCLEKAGERALREYSNHEAIVWLDDAIGLADRLPTPVNPVRRGRWERWLADACLNRGDIARGTLHADRALQAFGQPALPATSATQGFGLFREVLRRIAQGWLPRRLWTADAAESRSVADAAHVYNLLLEPKMLNNELLLGLYCGMRNVNLAERVAISPALARGYAMMAAVLCATPLGSVAGAWAERATRAADAVGEPAVISYAYARSATWPFISAEWDEALRMYTRSADQARAEGDMRRLAEVDACVAASCVVRGRFAEGLEKARAALASGTTSGDLQARTWGHGLLLECLLRLGREQEALAESALAAADLGRVGDGERTWMQANVALAAWQARDRARARAAADEALALARRSAPVVFVFGYSLGALAEVYVHLWDDALRDAPADAPALAVATDQAVRILETYARVTPYARPLAALWRGSQAWRAGKRAAARRRWAAALRESERHDMVHAQGSVLFEMGRHDDGPARRPTLERALAAFVACGALRDQARVREVLEAGAAV